MCYTPMCDNLPPFVAPDVLRPHPPKQRTVLEVSVYMFLFGLVSSDGLLFCDFFFVLYVFGSLLCSVRSHECFIFDYSPCIEWTFS